MRKRLNAVTFRWAGLALVVASCAAAATPSDVRLIAAPRGITLGQTWRATLKIVGTGTAVISARQGTIAVRASPVHVAGKRYRVSLRLRATGKWQITAAFAGMRFRLGSVSVRAAPPFALDNPAQTLVAPDGTLLVSERGVRNRILRVDPATGTFSVFATGINAPWGLGFAPDGAVLVSSTSGLYRVTAGGAPTRIADVSISPFAVLPGGDTAFANETSVGIIPTAASRPRILSTAVNFAHGLARLPDGDLAVSDTGNKRLLRIDPADGSAKVIAAGLKTPMGLAAEPSGSLLVIEFDSGSILRVDDSGATTTVASGFKTPYGLTRADDGTLYVTEAGEVARATGSLRRIAADGTITTIRLKRG